MWSHEFDGKLINSFVQTYLSIPNMNPLTPRSGYLLWVMGGGGILLIIGCLRRG